MGRRATQSSLTARARPFRLTSPPAPLEADLHAQAAEALDRWLAEPAVWYSYPAGHIRLSPAEVSRLSRIGLKRGMPDIFIFYRRVYCVELKRPGGQLSRSTIGRNARGAPVYRIGQEEQFERLIRSGAVQAIAVCTSVEAMMMQLVKWGIPLNGMWGN